jgi:N-dimethylarginine dimethylaminohydrolase
MIHSLDKNRNDIEISRYIYAQYFFEVVFMTAIVCLSKNKTLIKKFDDKFKKQEEKHFKDLFQDNRYANMNSEEKNILFKKINTSI